MDKIITTLSVMGVTATEKEVAAYLSTNKISADRITDLQLVELGQHLSAKIEPAKPAKLATGSRSSSTQVLDGPDVLELETPFSQTGKEHGAIDGQKAVDHYQAAYLAEFQSVTSRISTFRSDIRRRALESIGA